MLPTLKSKRQNKMSGHQKQNNNRYLTYLFENPPFPY